MAQVVLKFLSIFCGIPGAKYITPFFTPLINPSSWSLMLLCFFLPILSSGGQALSKDEDGKTSGKKAFRSAFFIWYGIAVIITCSLMQAACKVSNSLPI